MLECMDYDVMEFSDLPEVRKEFVRKIIREYKESDALGIDITDHYALKAFNVIAPHREAENRKLLLSDLKNYNTLRNHYTIADATAGLFTVRAYFAHLYYIRRFLTREHYQEHEHMRHLLKYGYTVFNNFLDDKNDIDQVISIIDQHPLAVHKSQASLVDRGPDTHPLLRNIMDDMTALALNAIGMNIDHDEDTLREQFTASMFIQRLMNKPDDNDVQKVLHCDTFFPAIKMWYFPKEVSFDGGPFNYIPESHLFTRNMAKFVHEQTQSIFRGTIEEWRTYGHAEGSLRASMEELKDIVGANYCRVHMEVDADTLVIANVAGYHARGGVNVPTARDAIHGSLRPKLPFEL